MSKSKVISFRKERKKSKKINKLLSFLLAATLLFTGTSYGYAQKWHVELFGLLEATNNQSRLLSPHIVDIGNSRVIKLMSQVDSGMAKRVATKILNLNSIDKNKPIVLLIDSPGGSIVAGRKILDSMEFSKAPIYAQIVGQCASMAALIAVHADKIYATKSSYLLFHNASLSFGPTDIREVRKWLKFWDAYLEEIDRSTAKRLGITYEVYLERITNTWVMTATQAVTEGYIDGYIVDFVCESGPEGCLDELYEPEKIQFFPF